METLGSIKEMITRTQLKKFNKLWKHLPPGLNDFGIQEYITKLAPMFRLTKKDLSDIVGNVVYDKEKNKFFKKDSSND